MGPAQLLSERLAAGELVIIDGGTGSQLQAEGVPMDERAWCARANLDHLDVVQRVHEAYLRRRGGDHRQHLLGEPDGLGACRARRPGRRRQPQRGAGGAASARCGRVRPGGGAGSMSSFSPGASMRPGGVGAGRSAGPADRFPDLADYREQAELLAEAGVDLITLEMIDAVSYGRAALQAAAETGLPVWLGVSPVRLDDGTVGTLPELGDGASLEDLLVALLDPAPDVVTVMHASPEVTPDAIDIVRAHFAGPVGAYAETGTWAPPNWVFDGLSPEDCRKAAATWVARGARLVGGCCGTGPQHIRALAEGRRSTSAG